MNFSGKEPPQIAQRKIKMIKYAPLIDQLAIKTHGLISVFIRPELFDEFVLNCKSQIEKQKHFICFPESENIVDPEMIRELHSYKQTFPVFIFICYQAKQLSDIRQCPNVFWLESQSDEIYGVFRDNEEIKILRMKYRG